MKIARQFLCFALLVVFGLSTQAASINKCVTAKGDVTYTNLPCSPNEKGQEVGSYDAADAEKGAFIDAMRRYAGVRCALHDVGNVQIWKSKIHTQSESITDYDDLLSTSEFLARQDPGFNPNAGCMGSPATAARLTSSPVADDGAGSAEKPRGYQCSANGKAWIQSTSCPESSVAFTPVTGVSGFDQHGNFIADGTGTQREDVSVSQQELSHDDVCDRLRDRMQTSEHDKGQTSVYDRNKMRHAEGC